jgi:hypothetical protein
MQPAVVAQLDYRQIAPRNLRGNDPYQDFFSGAKFFIYSIERDIVLCANLVPVVPVNQSFIPKDERVAAAVLDQIRFKRGIRLLIKRRQQAFKLFVNDYRLHTVNLAFFIKSTLITRYCIINK